MRWPSRERPHVCHNRWVDQARGVPSTEDVSRMLVDLYASSIKIKSARLIFLYSPLSSPSHATIIRRQRKRHVFFWPQCSHSSVKPGLLCLFSAYTGQWVKGREEVLGAFLTGMFSRQSDIYYLSTRKSRNKFPNSTRIQKEN